MQKSSLYFTEHHHQFRKETRAFLMNEIVPLLESCEHDQAISRIIWEKMGQQGLLGLYHPKQWGGSEKDIFYTVILLEELGRTGYVGFRIAIALQAYMTTYYIQQKGSHALKQNYLHPAIVGKKISALAITEEDAGSDLSQIKTNARCEGHDFIIYGKKYFVANGTTADFIIALVKTSNTTALAKKGALGLSLIIIDRQSPGVKTTKMNTLGLHTLDTAFVSFDNVRVPQSNLLGDLNKGFLYVMQGMQLERLSAGLLAIGGNDYCLKLTRAYLSKRKLYGSAAYQLQSIRHKMADLTTEQEAIRQLAYHTAWLYAHQIGAPPMKECSMVKLYATELSKRVVDACLQFHGGKGYQADHPLSRIHRDIQATTITAGTSEVMRDMIASLG